MNQLLRCVAMCLACSFAALLALHWHPVSAGWHDVLPGETLWEIGEQYGVDAAEIAAENNLDSTELIYAGQVLWIPEDGGAQTGGEPIVHVVEPGETIASIADTYGVDPFSVVMVNGIDDPNLIFPGQAITIPFAELPVAPQSPPTTGNIDLDVPYFDEATVRETIVTLSSAYGWDAYLILSLAWRESGWDQRALSPGRRGRRHAAHAGYGRLGGTGIDRQGC